MKMYPPKGGESIEAHPSNVKYLISIGFTKKPKTKTKTGAKQ